MDNLDGLQNSINELGKTIDRLIEENKAYKSLAEGYYRKIQQLQDELIAENKKRIATLRGEVDQDTDTDNKLQTMMEDEKAEYNGTCMGDRT